MAKEQSATKERQRTDLREPKRYKVTIYNDDFTTMEFVVMILKVVFFKSEADAQTLMDAAAGLLTDPARREKMSKALRALSASDAMETIYAALMELSKRN